MKKEKIVMLGYPAVELEEHFEDRGTDEVLDEWFSGVKEMHRKITKILNSAARNSCASVIKCASNYARKNGRMKTEYILLGLPYLYLAATGEKLPEEIPKNIRKKYPK